jgi:hypothetical protein
VTLLTKVQWSGYIASPTPSPVTFIIVAHGWVRLHVNRKLLLNATAGSFTNSSAEGASLIARPCVLAPGGLSEIILEYHPSTSSSFITLQVVTSAQCTFARQPLTRFSAVAVQRYAAHNGSIIVTLHSFRRWTVALQPHRLSPTLLCRYLIHLAAALTHDCGSSRDLRFIRTRSIR